MYTNYLVDCSHIHSYHTGVVNGFPRFVEQNKVGGHPYKEVIPAEIIYCADIGSWVFWHPNIKTSPPDKPEYEVSSTLFTSYNLKYCPYYLLILKPFAPSSERMLLAHEI